MKWIVVPVLTASLLAATAPVPKVGMPSQFAHVSGVAGTSSQPARLESWWRVFGDGTLNSLMERAAENNLDVHVALARVAEARAARGVSKSALLPSVSISASVSKLRGGFAQGVTRISSSPGSGSLVSPFESNIYQAGFDARWELDLFGGLRNGVKAASADLAAADEARRDVLLTVLAEVARNYAELRGTQEQLAIAHKNIAARRDTLELVRVRVDAGLATQLDAEQQTAQLASLESVVPALEASELAAIHRLGVLLGEQPQTMLADLRTPAPKLTDPDEVPVGLPGELLKRRPDVRRAEAEVYAAFARVGVARADLYPKFVITGLSGRQTTEFTGFTLGAGNFFAVGPGIEVPLFTAGRIRFNIAVQKARLEQAVIRYRQDVLAAMEETENALAAYRAQHERREKLTAALTASRRAVALSEELYARGLADFLTVLEAQRQQYAAEDDLTRCDTQLVTQAVALYKALGGGWEKQ